jgi:hypothetical protein
MNKYIFIGISSAELNLNSLRNVFDMIYLTAIGLTPCGSSTHLHTKQDIEQHNQTIHRTTYYRHKQYMEQYNSRISNRKYGKTFTYNRE